MFEKYDGIRGFWNPETKSFYSRLGNKFRFPQHIIDAMPTDVFFDGELWYTYPSELMAPLTQHPSTGLDVKGFRNR